MKHLVIGPGAMAFFAFLGALSALQDADELHNLEDVSGASAGGLAAFFYVAGKGDMKRIIDYTLRIPIKEAMRYNIRLFFKNFGLVTSQKIKAVITDIILVFLEVDEPHLTFRRLRQLRPNGPRLYVSAYCVNLGRTEYFSDLTTPDMEVVNALCMTIAVPFLFSSIDWNGHRYIDGGTAEESPCGIFLSKDPRDVCIIRHSPFDLATHDTTSFKTYMMSMLAMTLHLRHKYPHIRSIDIDTSVFQMFDFSMKLETKIKMFSAGYTIAHRKVLPKMIPEEISKMNDHQEQSSPVHEHVPEQLQDPGHLVDSCASVCNPCPE